ncbi:hypothetical protein HKX54_04445 [Sulfitobacter sp. M57]|uniref:hypothetical protein n=1 Tax=unclassified Sulfitobacter TaxID=196795 RepID=UPI0023E34595|nr:MULTISPECIES: hypothetical protein [unclassified Sulfitobacter]MDF3413697.1 hypothetical protein [Sulfitobacter sp. KE5]MDF3421022.1 hypothetical protein [Sulfitobacter sp. KE43]MDF3432243.1 hypothetical protein [Sulfitobacter sp. KE42]MDF3457882.1 hypothetical protein [Sulfitobacter sp. S74]MDF3461783.1 hypothetical protein [Sulfitobacter sp. Ks18]
MKHLRPRLIRASLIYSITLLVACAPLETYYKPGASVTTLNRDTTTCEVNALKDVPVSFQIRRNPPVFVPGNRSCDADGNCTGHHGYYIDGGVESYDPNVALRNRVETQCMADKGYAPVSIPPCPDSIARATPAAATTRLPALTKKSCVIRNKSGSFQIVNRAP